MLRNNGVRPKNWASAGIAPTPRYRTRPGAKPAPRSTGKPESHFQCLLRDSETIFRNPQPNDTPDLLPARPLARENANTAEGYGEAPSWLTTIPTRTTPTSPSNNWTPTAWRPGRTHSSPGCFRNSSISSHRHGRRCHPHHRLHSSLHAGATNLLRDNIPTGAGQDRGSSPVRHGDVHRGLPHIRSWSDNEPAGRNQNGTGTSRGMTPWPPGPPRCGMNYARPKIPTDSFELPTRKAPDPQRPRTPRSEISRQNPRSANLPRRRSQGSDRRSTALNQPQPKPRQSGNNSCSTNSNETNSQTAKSDAGFLTGKGGVRPRRWASARTARMQQSRTRAGCPTCAEKHRESKRHSRVKHRAIVGQRAKTAE